MKRILGWSLATLLVVATGTTTATAGNWDDSFFDRPWSSHRHLHRIFVEEAEPHAPFDFSVLGGVQTLRRNAPVLFDNVYSVPTTGILGVQVNPSFALEGEFSLAVPLLQDLQIADGVTARRKGPDLLLYQAGVRVSAPGESYLLYVAGGAGMATFLVNAEPTRFPQIERVEDMPAFNAGAGAMFYMSPAWSLRLDFRQFALLPPGDSQLSTDRSTLWLQRVAIGLTYGHQSRVIREERDEFPRSSW